MIAKDWGGKAEAGAAGEESVFGIDFEERSGGFAGLAVGGAGDDEAVELFDIPTGVDEFAAEPVEEEKTVMA